MKIHKIKIFKNSFGFGHIEIFGLLAIIAVISLVGARVIFESHAAPIKSYSTQWIIGRGAYNQLRSVNASPQLLGSIFNNSRTYYVSNGDNSGFPNAVNTQTFTSYATLQTAIANKQINPSVGAILYDNENWTFTPVIEQQNPVLYAKKAATLARANGYKIVFTPAANLANVLSPGNKNRFDAFLALNILGQTAPYVDAIEFQSQDLEGTPQFKTFVQQAAAQINAGKHGAIFAGLSSEPSAGAVTLAQLRNDFRQTQKYVNGYWLNIPKQSTYCPKCGTGNPALALEFLKTI